MFGEFKNKHPHLHGFLIFALVIVGFCILMYILT